MSYKGRTIAGAVGSFVASAPSWWGLFLDHPEALDWLFAYAPIWVPVMVFSFGCFTGHSFCKWMSGSDAYRKLAKSIPSLSERERGILLIAYSMGDVWAQDDMMGPASSLLANGYLAMTYSGGLRGECYVMPGSLREEIAKRPSCQKALNDAEAVVLSWGYTTSRR